MKPVFQTKQHCPPHVIGNCYRACIASILEISIEDIPAFEEAVDYGRENPKIWWQMHNDFFDDRGLLAHRHAVREGVPKGYAILSGKSPRHDSGHCVVVLDGKIVHDPAGIEVEPIKVFWDYTVIIPKEQSRIECLPARILDRYYKDWIADPSY